MSHCLPDNGFLFYSYRMSDLQFSKKPLFKLLPAFLVMLAIFLFSARPSDAAPLDLLMRILYKTGHVAGYALLALSYWRACEFRANRRWFVWLLAITYAVTDEFHQSFVPGRHPAAFDVLVYDNLGALFALWLTGILLKRKQPVLQNLVVDR